MNDASDEDDDLPVLTQVLRIGGVRAGALPVAEPDHAPGDFAIDGATESPLDEILLPDPLVIGSEPHERREPYVPLTTAMIDASERPDEPMVQTIEPSTSTSPSTTQSLIVPFIEPVDLPPPAPAALDQDATDDVVNDATEADLEQRGAANDAEDADAALRKPVTTVEPATASIEEHAPGDEIAPAPFDHDAFATRMRESVLNDLSARIDTEFDARIAQTLRAEVEAALANLHANLREQLADAMRDVVRRAVEEEVARLRQAPGEMPREEPSE